MTATLPERLLLAMRGTSQLCTGDELDGGAVMEAAREIRRIWDELIGPSFQRRDRRKSLPAWLLMLLAESSAVLESRGRIELHRSSAVAIRALLRAGEVDASDFDPPPHCPATANELRELEGACP